MPAGLRACLQVAAELRAAAVDASSDLPMRERRALATLATAVEARAAWRAGIEINGAAAETAVAEALAALDDARGQGLPSSVEDI